MKESEAGRRTAFERLEDRRLLSITPFTQVATDLKNELDGVQSKLTALLDAYQTGTHSSLPFVGDKLGDAAQVVNRFGSQLHDALNALGNTNFATPNDLDAAIRGALAPALGSAGLGVLADQSGAVSTSSTTDAADILITHPSNLGSGGVEIDMRLHAGQILFGGSLDFATGLSGLPIELTANAGIHVTAGFDFELAFTYNANTSAVGLDPAKTLPSGHELAVSVDASLPTIFSATGTVGFIRGQLTPVPGETNALTATVYADSLDSTPALDLVMTADANLRMTGGFGDIGGISAGDLPSVSADFHLHWQFDSSNPTAGKPNVSFDNVGMNLGAFLNNMLAPVISDIQTITQQIQPVLDVLNAPLPVLSDLSHLVGLGDVNLIGLAKLSAPFAGLGPLADLVSELDTIITDVDMVKVSADDVTVPLGGFDLNDIDLRLSDIADKVDDLAKTDLTKLTVDLAHVQHPETFSYFVASLNVPQGVKDALNDLTAGLTNGVDFEFPILNDPSKAIFNLLLGKDSDLFTMKAEMHLHAEEHSNDFSVFGMGLDFGGAINVDAKFTFAYDTFGLREMIGQALGGTLDANKIASDITDGFYVGDDSYLKLGGSIGVSAGVSVGFFGISVGGSVSTADGGATPVSITINDPNHDGKLRFAEVPSDPLNAFNASGELDAGLGIQLKVGVKVLGHFVGYEKDFDIANTVLISFPAQHPPVVTLASQADSSGDVNLYIGALAADRVLVDQTDGNENYVIRHIGDDSDGETIAIDAFNKTQIIHHVKKISGLGDVGDLTIIVDPGVESEVALVGGQGSAHLIYSGKGKATLTAGQLDSNLTGGDGSNFLFGGPGSDTLTTGSGDNVLVDSAGNNTIVISGAFRSLALTNTSSGQNTLEIVALGSTNSIAVEPSSGNLDVLIQNQAAPNSHAVVANFSQLLVNAHGQFTGIALGELSTAGIRSETVDGTGGDPKLYLDTNGAGGPDSLSLSGITESYPLPAGAPGTIVEHGNSLANITTGVTTNVFGAEFTAVNGSIYRDSVYSTNATGGFILAGDFSVDLGWLLLPNGAVVKPESLLGFTDFHIDLHFSSSSAAATQIVLDGNLDAAGADYGIGGGMNQDTDAIGAPGPYFGQFYNVVTGPMVTVKTYQYRSQDEVVVDLPGGSVGANLATTVSGTFRIDGSARLAGTNPTAPNAINLIVPPGGVTMDTAGLYGSVLRGGRNLLYVLGSMPQDSLALTQPTDFQVTPGPESSSDVFPSTIGIQSILNGFIFDGGLAFLQSQPPPGQSFVYALNLPATGIPFVPGTSLSWAGDDANPTILDNQPPNVGSYHDENLVYIRPGVGSVTFPIRVFSLSSHPIATDNSVDLDASQLRGTLSYSVSDPDYATAQQLFRSFGQSSIAFGKTTVNLETVNPQLAVTISGQDPLNPNTPHIDQANALRNLADNRIPTTDISVGGGVLANIQGNVVVRNARLTIDDASGTRASVETLTASNLAGWATAAGAAQPTLSFDSSLHDDFTITGSPFDRFDVEGTPITGDAVFSTESTRTYHQTLIQNPAASGAPTEVYVMAKSLEPLNVAGNIALFIGRRLHADGTVDAVGLADNVFANSQPVTFEFVGVGLGPLTVDLSHETNNSITGIFGNADYRGQGYVKTNFGVHYNSNGDDLIYGPNTELFVDAPTSLPVTLLIDNAVAATVHYIDDPQSSNSTVVNIGAAAGPVDVQGNGANTRVVIDPTSYSSGGVTASSLRDTITADVSVSNAMLEIVADAAGAAALVNPPNAVLTDTQLTGLANGTIHFHSLVNILDPLYGYNGDIGLLALKIQLPRSASLTTLIENSPAAVTTEIATAETAGPVVVTGTTGKLWLGRSVSDHDGRVSFRALFSATSVNIGGGSLQGLLGPVALDYSSAVPTTIDDHAGSASRPVKLAIGPMPILDYNHEVEDYNYELDAPIPIYFGKEFNLATSPALSILGAPGTAHTILANPLGTKLFAGPGSSVNVTTDQFYSLDILGAGSVQIAPESILNAPTPLTVEADPARPADLTELTVTYSTNSRPARIDIGNGGAGFGVVSWTYVLPQTVHYQSNVTHLSVLGTYPGNSGPPITLTDTGAAGTTIEPVLSTVLVQGTTGPLTITQAPAGAHVVLGNAGNLQSLHGEIDIVATNVDLQPLLIPMDDSADGTGRTVVVSSDAGGDTLISGLAPGLIKIVGTLADVTVFGGIGGNRFQVADSSSIPMTLYGSSAADVLVGPDAITSWQIRGANSGSLDANVAFGEIANLQGGADADTFAFTPGGSLSGNLDGGPGVDRLDYAAAGLYGSEPLDLPHGVAPRIAGLVSNIEQVSLSFALAQPLDQISLTGAIVELQIQTIGGFGDASFAATGLPNGLTIDSQTGAISGAIDAAAELGSPFHVTVTSTEGADAATTSFLWTVTPTFRGHAYGVNSAEGQTFHGAVAFFTYEEPSARADDFSASIDWGDGVSTSGAIAANGNSGFDVIATHAYAEAGVYSVQVTVFDAQGRQGTFHSGWASSTSLIADRFYLGAVTGLDGRIYAVGGYDDKFTQTTAIDAYDLTTGAWTTVTHLPSVVSEFAVTRGHDGRIYVFGGYDSRYNYSPHAWAYDPATDRWSALADMPTSRRDFAAATGGDGRIYVMGGGGRSGLLATVSVYDPASNTWSAAADMLDGRAFFAAASGSDGRIYAMGGYGGGGDMAAAEVYDPATNAWTAIASLSTPRREFAAAVGSDSRIYVIGGYDDGFVATVEAYDPVTGIWAAEPSLSVPRADLAATATPDGRIWAIGGYSNAGGVSTVETLVPPTVISDAALYSNGVDISARQQNAFTGVVATFLDDNGLAVAGDFTATINWGDSQTSPGVITSDGNGGFDVSGANVYSDAGTYGITVAIQDIGGKLATATSNAIVSAFDPLTVANANDSGPGSLRQAISNANSTPGADTIRFQLPLGAQTIDLATPLPAVTDPMTVSLDATQNVTFVLSSGTAWNNDDSLTLAGAGTLALRSGGIEGTGNLAVNTGSYLMAGHIIQNTLTIGGAAGSPAMVTIAASDSSGNPLSTATASFAIASGAASAAEVTTAEAALSDRLTELRARLARAATTETSVDGDAAARGRPQRRAVVQDLPNRAPSVSAVVVPYLTDELLGENGKLTAPRSSGPALNGQPPTSLQLNPSIALNGPKIDFVSTHRIADIRPIAAVSAIDAALAETDFATVLEDSLLELLAVAAHRHRSTLQFQA
jgi:N-acetylneuraminic acid mutarotase